MGVAFRCDLALGLDMGVVVTEESIRLVDEFLSPFGVHRIKNGCSFQDEVRDSIAISGQFVLVGSISETRTVTDEIVQVLRVVPDALSVLDD